MGMPADLVHYIPAVPRGRNLVDDGHACPSFMPVVTAYGAVAEAQLTKRSPERAEGVVARASL